MEIISHRGYWRHSEEKNSIKAFERSFSLGFGTETDVRDFNGELVISHDIASKNSILLSEFLSIYNKQKCTGTLAINIKADGLQKQLKEIMDIFSIKNYFIFDSSIPDTIESIKQHLPCFIRYSEFEPKNNLWNKANGIWFDRFSPLPLDIDTLKAALELNLKVAIVSEELHNRDPLSFWEKLSELPKKYISSNNLILCTDTPETAKEFFNEK